MMPQHSPNSPPLVGGIPNSGGISLHALGSMGMGPIGGPIGGQVAGPVGGPIGGHLGMGSGGMHHVGMGGGYGAIAQPSSMGPFVRDREARPPSPPTPPALPAQIGSSMSPLSSASGSSQGPTPALHVAAKPFYPAYSSPHLKSVTTFAETRLTKSFGCFVATFAGFSCFPTQVGAPVSSPVVEVDGHFWSIRLFACGVDDTATGFISCYLVHESDEPVRTAVKLTLINAKFSSDNHIAATDTDKLMTGKGSTIGWAKFIHQSSYSRYCTDDVLVLRVDLTLFVPPKQIVLTSSRRTRAVESAAKPIFTLLDSVSGLLGDTASMDMHFVVENEVIGAHKFILALRSPVLKAVFGLGIVKPANREEAANGVLEDFPPESVRVNEETGIAEVSVGAGVEAAAVREMVRYLYTDNLSQEALRQHYDQLLALGCRFQVAGLMSTCAGHMYSTICADNVSRILKAADACGAHDLRAKALAYIVKNAKDVVQHSEFFENLNSDLRREVILALASAPSK